jgi:hypothetical protein
VDKRFWRELGVRRLTDGKVLVDDVGLQAGVVVRRLTDGQEPVEPGQFLFLGSVVTSLHALESDEIGHVVGQ